MYVYTSDTITTIKIGTTPVTKARPPAPAKSLPLAPPPPPPTADLLPVPPDWFALSGV